MKKVIYSLFSFCAVLTLQAETMVVATYNLRNANGGDSTNGNGWGQRYPYIAQIVQFHGFDIFGTQEGKYPQLQDLRQAMPGYDYIGVGRDDGKRAGEHSAIFYRTDKFEVLEHGDFWLSEITDRPNKGWDAVLPRICTWGEFRDKQTGSLLVLQPSHGPCRRTGTCRERQADLGEDQGVPQETSRYPYRRFQRGPNK